MKPDQMNQKGFANIILVVVIVVLLGVVGYFALVKKSEPIAQQPSPTLTTTQTKAHASPTPTSTSQATNLKTYTNTKHGFEFQYPYKSLSVAEGYVSSIDPKNLVYIVNIFTIPHGQDRDGLVGVFNLPLNQTRQSLGFAGQTMPTVNYNGITWTKLSRQDAPSDYLVERNGQTFWLAYSSGIKQSDFESIINTFKFTK